MAQGEYKVGQAIKVTYQATKATTGLTDVRMDVYDESQAIDVALSSTMSEIASTGHYHGNFTPDVEGEWSVQIDSGSKAGKVIKQFSVVGHNIDGVGDAIGTIDGKADGIKAKTDSLPANPAAVSDVALYASNIQGTDNDTLKDISDQLDGIATPDSPPMIG